MTRRQNRDAIHNWKASAPPADSGQTRKGVMKKQEHQQASTPCYRQDCMKAHREAQGTQGKGATENAVSAKDYVSYDEDRCTRLESRCPEEIATEKRRHSRRIARNGGRQKRKREGEDMVLRQPQRPLLLAWLSDRAATRGRR